MSLLSGIRFVPREDRRGKEESDESSSDSEESERSHKKTHKKHKSDSKHKKKKKEKEKEKKKSKDKRKHKSSREDIKRKYNEYKKFSKGGDKNPDSAGFDHEAEIKYMESLVESEGLLMDQSKSKTDFESYNMYDNNNNRSSMIDYSKHAMAENISSDDDEDIASNNYETAHNTQEIAPAPVASSKPSISTVKNNHDVAALLRARLQKGEKLISPSAPPQGTGRSMGMGNQHGDSDLASFMSVGELKWMAAYKLKEKEGTLSTQNVEGGISKENDMSLQDLVTMEKMGGGITGNSGNIDKIFAENIIKRGSGYRGSELGLGSGMGASAGMGGDKAGMDEEEGMGMTSWLGTEADIDSDDNNGDGPSKKKPKVSASTSKKAMDKIKKREKDLVNGVDMTMFQQKEDKLNEKQMYDRIMKKALTKKKAFGQTTSHCRRCVSGRQFRRELVVSTGSHFQLRLKSRNESLVPGWHCELVPLMHASSVLLAEKDSESDSLVRDGQTDGGFFKELELFKSCLQRMYKHMKKGVIFTEAATRSGEPRYHTVVDVVPVDLGLEGDVEMSFKQTFRDSGDAFSTHKRRIISTNSATRTFQSCVPSHFPYILVEWGDISSSKVDSGKKDVPQNGGQVGLVYVLDAAISINDTELEKGDTTEHGTSYCLDVMAGVLEIDQLERRLMRQRGEKSGGSAAEKEEVRRFQEEWSYVDWTA